MSKTIGLAMALSLAVIATPAWADSVQIKTSDLDLSTEAGNKMLDQRIQQAARKICGASEAVTGSRIPSKSNGECVRRVVGEARQKVAANRAGTSG